MNLTSVVVDHAFAIPKDFRSKIIRKYVDKNTKFICLSTTLLGTPGNIWTRIAECDDLFEPIMQEIKIIAPKTEVDPIKFDSLLYEKNKNKQLPQ